MIPLVTPVLAIAIFVATILQPRVGAYTYLLVNPLIVGIARGEIAAFVRPNELLLVVIVAAAMARFCLDALSGRRVHLALGRLDGAFIILAVTGSIVPLMLRYGRGLPVTQDDLLYSLVLWKYFLLFRLFRTAILTPAQVGWCLRFSMMSAAMAAVIGILQVNNLFGVPAFLQEHYDKAFEGFTGVVTTRATSTLASSFGFVDVMIMNLLIALALLHIRHPRRWLLIAAAGLFLSGCLAAGQFSGFIGLAVALLAVGLLVRRLGTLVVAGIPAVAVAAMLFWPVIAERLEGFAGPVGMPRSWVGRWNNLSDVFFPELARGLNWLIGVQPAARLPAPEPWRDWIYIESGYVWLLWIGGFPFLVAYAYFVYTAAKALWPQIRGLPDEVWAASVASLCFLAVIVVLMVLDPHLTVRGSADLFFPLLAISTVLAVRAHASAVVPLRPAVVGGAGVFAPTEPNVSGGTSGHLDRPNFWKRPIL